LLKTAGTDDLGGRTLRSYFVGLRTVLGIAGDLQFHFVAGDGPFVLGYHLVPVEFTGNAERHLVAIHLAIRDIARRDVGTAPAHTGNAAGELGAIGLQRNRYLARRATLPASLFKGPLAGDIRSHKGERCTK